MSTMSHLHISVRGALRHPQDLVNCITVDGKLLTKPKEVKQFLEYQLAMGREKLPCGECEGFDYINGCPGHEEKEANHE